MKKKKNIFPSTVLFFIKKIQDGLKKKCWTFDSNYSEYVCILTKEYDYDWDAINIIQRYMSQKQWHCKLTYFSRKDTYNTFTFEMRRI